MFNSCRWLLWSSLSFMFATLTGCDILPWTADELRSALSQEPFVQKPVERAWIAEPTAQIVLERSLPRLSEQRILLPNHTVVSGDNAIYLTARRMNAASAGRLEPERLFNALEKSATAPFMAFDDLSFSSRTDELGVLNWAVWTNNAGLNCVLAFRRLDETTRVLPRGVAYIDMVLRNCIHGTVEEALVPALPEHAGFSAGSTPDNRGPQMLSPLAGPRP